MICLYTLLLQSSGLSAREAAKLHGISYQTVTLWSGGNAAPSEEAVRYLYRLIDLQTHAASWLLHLLKERDEARPAVSICITDNEHESGTLGWPTPSAMNTAVRRLLEMAGDDLRSRIQLMFNPEAGRSDIYYISIRLRPDGTPRALGEMGDADETTDYDE
jgi:transcriptional regulator with XRE-family HTH domain